MTFCVRYVDDTLAVNERFLGFWKTDSTKSATLFTLVKSIYQETGLKMDCLVGQCYDGASNMSGCQNGLQTLITKEVPAAIFVHCYAHQINLVYNILKKISLVATDRKSLKY